MYQIHSIGNPFFTIRQLNTSPEQLSASCRVSSRVQKTIEQVFSAADLANHLDFHETASMVEYKRKIGLLHMLSYSVSRSEEMANYEKRYFEEGTDVCMEADCYEKAELWFALARANMYLLIWNQKKFKEELENVGHILRENEELSENYRGMIKEFIEKKKFLSDGH